MLSLILASGSLAFAGGTNDTPKSALPAPDYAKAESWLAYPGRPSRADDTPAGRDYGSASQKNTVDVFFIHPTTFMSFFSANARYDEPGPTETRLENGVLRFQASVFNACCRIFAPHYRQATLTKITSVSPAGTVAAELAYSDVLRAFDYYIAHENKGRPFIIASHSQGSTHAIRLLQERVIGTPLFKKMVAAYVIGGSLPRAIEEKGLPICRAETMTNCVVTWNTVSEGKDDVRRKEKSVVWWDGRYQPMAGRPMVCVNPLTWTIGGVAEASANPGSVYSDGIGKPIPAPLPHVTGAACKDMLLHVTIAPDARRHFSDMLSLFGIYHDFDYGLFYVSLRHNVAVRIRTFLISPRV